MTETDKFFFDFDSFDVEITRKLLSFKVSPDILMGLFLKQLSRRNSMTNKDVEKVSFLYKHLKEFPFDNIYANYLSHPIRVAWSYARISNLIHYDDVVLALCHNIVEAGWSDQIDPKQHFITSDVRSQIKLLTIDRSLEKDQHYLSQYYSRICNHSDQLMLLKALDKLDNVLWWVVLKMETYHAGVILKHVCPRLSIKYSACRDYLQSLVYYVESEEAKSKFKKSEQLIPSAMGQVT